MATPDKDLKQMPVRDDPLAATYEKLTSGLPSKVAAAALAHLPLSSYTSESHILDSACGPGVVTNLLLGPAPSDVSLPTGLPLNPPPKVTGIDIAPGMIAQFLAKSSNFGWKTANAFVRDAGDLSCFADAEFDAVIMNLGIFSLSDPVQGAAEMYRVLKPGGICIVSVWKHRGFTSILQNTMGAIRKDTDNKVSLMDPIWEAEGYTASVLTKGGFEEGGVDTFTYDGRWQHDSAEDLADAMNTPFWTERLFQGWTEEEKGRWRSELFNQLSEEEKKTASVEMNAWISVAKK